MTYRQDVGVKGVQVNHEVDASVGKGLHAAVVVCVGVDMINTQRVGAELFHETRISLALLGVNERVFRSKLVRDAYIQRVSQAFRVNYPLRMRETNPS
jgi:hypothetical protein